MGWRGGGEDCESRRLEWVRRRWNPLGVGAKVEGQPEVRVGSSSFVRLDSVRETEGKMLNGGCECRVGKCE